MANSSTNLDLISASQSGKESTANALFDAASPTTLFGRRASTSSNLTWGYYGGTFMVDGVNTSIANGTLALTASSTNYVEATRAGVISVNTTGFTAGNIPLYTITTNTTVVTAYTDERPWVAPKFITADISVTVTTADVTLSAAQARAGYIALTGTLTGNRSVIVPVRGDWIVYNGCSGAFTVNVKTAAGSGVTVAAGDRVHVRSDGTNAVLISSALGGSTPSTGSVGKHAVYISAVGMLPSSTAGCADVARIDSAANQPDIVSLNFDASVQEFAQFSMVMPKKWNEGTITFKPHWSHAATTTNFGVTWSLQAVAVSNNDPITAAYGTAQLSNDTGGTTNYFYTGPESSAITIAGTPQPEDIVFFRVARVPADAGDTMAIDARLHGITVYLTTSAETDA